MIVTIHINIHLKPKKTSSHRCPFPIAWLRKKRGVSSENPEKQQVMIDGINQSPAHIFTNLGHDCSIGINQHCHTMNHEGIMVILCI